MFSTESANSTANSLLVLGRAYAMPFSSSSSSQTKVRDSLPRLAGRMLSARRAAFVALVRLQHGHEDRLDDCLRLESLNGPDRDLALELARGVERMRTTLDSVLARLVTKQLPTNPAPLTALRLGAYQLLYLDRIPAHAAVHETVGLLRDPGFANAVLRRLARMIEIRAADPQAAARELVLPGGRVLVFAEPCLPTPADAPAARLALEHGLPVFLMERWIQHLGLESATTAAIASSTAPAVTLRTNRLATSRDVLAAALNQHGTITQTMSQPAMLRWSGGRSPFQSDCFTAGWFVAQDATAVAAAEAMAIPSGGTALDLCAAPGTKTTLLAEQVAPHGKVFAFDSDARRRELIRSNVERLRLHEWVEVVDDLGRIPKVDAVLVDAPCSNTGVLAKRVEVRRRISLAAIHALVPSQRALLALAREHVRPNGRIVYSTCSIELEENQSVIRDFLAKHRDWQLRTEQLTLPRQLECDGGYYAVLEAASSSAP